MDSVFNVCLSDDSDEVKLFPSLFGVNLIFSVWMRFDADLLIVHLLYEPYRNMHNSYTLEECYVGMCPM